MYKVEKVTQGFIPTKGNNKSIILIIKISKSSKKQKKFILKFQITALKSYKNYNIMSFFVGGVNNIYPK